MATDDKHDLLEQATAKVLVDGNSVGTAWLVSSEGHLITAAHVVSDAEGAKIQEGVKVKFRRERDGREVSVIEYELDKNKGVDFAVLWTDSPPENRSPLLVSLARQPSGDCSVCGYGKTLEDQTIGKGVFNRRFSVRDEYTLFRLDSAHLGEEGYSGGAVYSHNDGAAVAIQTETSKQDIGANSNLVVAMPLYRVAELWPELYGIVALQFKKHNDWIRDQVENDHLDTRYVDPECKEPDGKQWPLDSFVEQWIDDDKTSILFVLGEYGSGKSWFCLHYAIKTFQELSTSGTSACVRIPLVSRLTDCQKNEVVVQCHGRMTLDEVTELNQTGNILLILDGLEDMEWAGDLENKLRLLKGLITSGSKIIVTARTSQFGDLEAAEAILTQWAPPKARSVVQMCDFKPEQIMAAIKMRWPGREEIYLERINSIFNLPDLVRRPVLLGIVSDNLPELRGRGSSSMTHADVYEIAIQASIKRDEQRGVSAEDHEQFLVEAAWSGFDEHRLDKTIAQSRIEALAGSNQALTGSSLLRSMDEDGDVEFIHGSFQEFLIAKKLQAAIRRKASQPLKTGRVYFEILRFLEQLIPEEEAKDAELQLRMWMKPVDASGILIANCIRLLGQFRSLDALEALIDVASNRGKKEEHRRDAIRSICRILCGEDDCGPTERIGECMTIGGVTRDACAIRTDRTTGSIRPLPIRINCFGKGAVDEAGIVGLDGYLENVRGLMLDCLMSKEPNEVRINASYAMIHFARPGDMARLIRVTRRKNEEHSVKLNCWQAICAVAETESTIHREQI